MNPPEVTIIIVNYNVRDLLVQCLASVYKHVAGPVEVIVVDNNSTDGSVERVKKDFPMVQVIRNDFNAGFPAANNQGLRIAKGEFIFLLNPDTALLEDSVAAMAGYLRAHGEVALLAPQLLNGDGSLQRSVYRFPRIRYLLAEMVYLERMTGSKYYAGQDFNKPFEIESAAGAALFFRRKLTDETGFLNEKLFWIEDIDFCYRLHQQGKRIVYFPETKIIHYSGQSAKKNYNVSISHQVINKIKFYKVHHSRFPLFVVILLSTWNTLTRLLVFTLLAPFKKIYYLKMKAYWFTLPKIFTATRGL
jgi:GT2 family glycosyltransferase